MKIRHYLHTNERLHSTVSPTVAQSSALSAVCVCVCLFANAKHFAGQMIVGLHLRFTMGTILVHGNFACKSSHLIQIKSKLMRLFAFEPLFCLFNESADFAS